jgi:hypothetical protein
VSTPAPAAAEQHDREAADRLQKQWWRNVLFVLRDPKPVFRAMRDDERPAAEARSEPALAVVLLAGIASVLSFSATSREFLDEPGVDGALVPVLAFLGGAVYGLAGYWLGGLALHLGVRGARGEGSYRQARHVLAYALVPLALSLLVVWPIQAVVFGADNFRSGGSDEGAGYWAFTGVSLVFLTWSLVLLVVGVRELHSWTTVRSLGALLLTGMALLAIALLGFVVSA